MYTHQAAKRGASLMVQWLTFHASNRAHGFDPWWGNMPWGAAKKKKSSSKKNQQSMCVCVKTTCPFSTESEEEEVNRYWLIWIYSHRWDCLLKEDFMNKRRRYLQAPLIDIICGTVLLSLGYRCVHLCAQRHADTISD